MADITTSYNDRIAALGFSSIRWNNNYLISQLFDNDLSKAVLDVKGNRTTDVPIIFK